MFSRQEINFEKSIPCHIINRTVEKREIFADEEDCLRFIFQMFAANMGRPALNLYRRDIIRAARALLRGEEIPEKLIIVEHPPLVDILSFALVITHNHLILSSNIEKGIPKYLHKLNLGFAKHFNLKYERKGSLFNRPYKIIPIQTNFQLDAVLRYVNIKNPLDVYQPGWTKEGLRDKDGAFNFLHNCQFSSFPDLFGERNSKIIAPMPILEKYLGEEITKSKSEYIDFIEDYLQNKMISHYPIFLEEN